MLMMMGFGLNFYLSESLKDDDVMMMMDFMGKINPPSEESTFHRRDKSIQLRHNISGRGSGNYLSTPTNLPSRLNI
jgi:hypothetical protein